MEENSNKANYNQRVNKNSLLWKKSHCLYKHPLMPHPWTQNWDFMPLFCKMLNTEMCSRRHFSCNSVTSGQMKKIPKMAHHQRVSNDSLLWKKGGGCIAAPLRLIARCAHRIVGAPRHVPSVRSVVHGTKREKESLRGFQSRLTHFMAIWP